MEIKQYLDIFFKKIRTIDEHSIMNLVSDIKNAYDNEKFIFLIGNGGSAAKASHLAQDLSKGVIIDQTVKKRIKALSLTDNVPYLTALANDDGYENVFVSQLRTFSKPGDYLLAISGSGNSSNVIKAAEYCKKNKIKVIGITGFDGGKLKLLSDTSVHVPLNEMAMVESIHSVIFHYVINYLRMEITGTSFKLEDFEF